MAAAQAGYQNVQNMAHQLQDKFEGNPFINDTPSIDGMLHLRLIYNNLGKITRMGHSLYDTYRQLAPGSDPANPGPAAVQQDNVIRQRAMADYIISCCVPGSNIYNLLSTDVNFIGLGAVCLDYVRGVIYIAPSADDARKHIRDVNTWTWEKLPASSKRSDLHMEWLKFLNNHNPKLHPSFAIPPQDIYDIFVEGVHPSVRARAMEIRDTAAIATMHGCMHPAVYPAYHPLGGQAHPNAGTRSLDLTMLDIHKQFVFKVQAGEVRLLNSAIAAVAVLDSSEQAPPSPLPSPPASDTSEQFVYITWHDSTHAGYNQLDAFAYAMTGRQSGQLRTCKNCGGVGHFAYKEGIFVCPTEEGMVPSTLLSNIKYPIDVNPWRFGKGKGKGNGKGAKGKGKGGSWYGGGKGRQGGKGYWVEPSWEWEPDIAAANSVETEGAAAPAETPSINAIAVDYSDYDGFNEDT